MANPPNRNVPRITSLADLRRFLNDQANTENCVYVPEVPEICRNYPCILAIAEVAKNASVGPAVYVAVYCRVIDSACLELPNYGTKDFSPARQVNIFLNILECHSVGWAMEIVTTCPMCNKAFNRPEKSANAISINVAKNLIRRTGEAGVNISDIYVVKSHGRKQYKQSLAREFPDYNFNIVSNNDVTIYGIQSVAEVCGMVIRECALLEWNSPENVEQAAKRFAKKHGFSVQKKPHTSMPSTSRDSDDNAVEFEIPAKRLYRSTEF